MDEHKSCKSCRHKGKREDEYPCRACTRNCIDKWEPVTNGSRIRGMNDEELADFLHSIAYAGNTPWSEPFSSKFCKSCPVTVCEIEGYHYPMELHECDFKDGKCPYGSDEVWWLNQPVEVKSR